MTEDEALELARIVANVDDVPLLEPIRVARRKERARAVWAIHSHYNAPGHNAGFTIDDRSAVVLKKEYVGFGARGGSTEPREFVGEIYPVGETILEREQWLNADPAVVFDFFVGLDGLQAMRTTSLAPPSTLSQPLAAHSRVTWKAYLAGRTFECTLRVEEFRQGERLVDVQEDGPFRRFQHLLVVRHAAGGALVRERIAYQMHYGVIGGLADSILGIERALEEATDARFALTVMKFGYGNR